MKHGMNRIQKKIEVVYLDIFPKMEKLQVMEHWCCIANKIFARILTQFHLGLTTHYLLGLVLEEEPEV